MTIQGITGPFVISERIPINGEWHLVELERDARDVTFAYLDGTKVMEDGEPC